MKNTILLLNLILIATPAFGKTTFFPKQKAQGEKKLTLTTSYFYNNNSKPVQTTGQYVGNDLLAFDENHLDINPHKGQVVTTIDSLPEGHHFYNSDTSSTVYSTVLFNNHWRKKLNESKDKLSFEQKIKVVAGFGGLFARNYDWEGFNDRVFNRGRVSTENLLNAVQHNYKAGVCTDFALAQSEMLQELGVDKKNIYIIAYTTYGTPHVNLAVTNPSDGSVVKLDYNYVSSSDQTTGSTALTQDNYHMDSGLAFRIYDFEGEPLYQLSTDVGKMLQDVTGELTDSSASKSYSLFKSTVSDGENSLTIFNGKTFSKDKVKGINVTKKIRPFNTALSLAYIYRSRKGSIVDLKQQALFLRMFNDVKILTSEIKKDLIFSVGLEADSQLLYTLKNNGVTTDLKKEPKLDMTINFSPYISYEQPTENGKLNVKFSANSYIDMNNIEGPYKGANLIGTLGSLNLKVSHRSNNSFEVSGELQTTKLGNHGRLNLSFEPDTNTKHKLSVSGSLSDDTPIFMPGQGKRIEYTYSKDGILKGSTVETSVFSEEKRKSRDNGILLDFKVNL